MNIKFKMLLNFLFKFKNDAVNKNFDKLDSSVIVYKLETFGIFLRCFLLFPFSITTSSRKGT